MFARLKKQPADNSTNFPTFVKIQLVSSTPLIILSPDSTVHDNNQQNNLPYPTQIVALSKLVPAKPISTEKIEVSTQTESNSNNPDLWLNFAQEEVNGDIKVTFLKLVILE